jgi:RNA-directed DNA polymerase
MELQASSGLTTPRWHQVNWAACHRRVRSLQRRIVQAVQAGAWRKVKRLSSLLVHSFAARARRQTGDREHRQKDAGDRQRTLGDAREESHCHRPHWSMAWLPPTTAETPLHSQENGTQRPLSIPTLEDRARQAIHLQALQPIAETTAEPNSYGFRPKRRCADAIAQCFNIFRQPTAATWILEGDIEGFFDHIAFPWLEQHIPMPKRLLAKWLRSGFWDRATLYPTTAGVPQGGIISPVLSNMVLDGLEEVVHGGHWHRRVHQINYVRWADDFIVTANSREVLEHTVLPAVNTFLAARGVRLSPHKTIITPLAQGFDFLGQTVRKHVRPNGKPAKLQITPSKASMQAVTAKVKTLCRHAAGATPAQLIDTLNPILRGWANYHRHSICSETFAHLDSFV